MRLSKLHSDDRPEWFEYEDTGIEFLISPAGTAEFDRRVRELMRPHLKAAQRKKGGKVGLTPELEDSINKRAVAEVCVHEFRGLHEDDGQEQEAEGLEYLEETGLWHRPIRYTADKCVELFQDHRLYGLWSWAWRIANLRDVRGADPEELGNSSSSSAGGPNGGETSNS